MTDTNVQDWVSARDEQIAQIAGQLVRGRVCFLFGAGMSQPSKGLSGSELAFELLRRGLFKKYRLPLDPDFERQLREVASRFPLEAIAEGVMHRLPFQESELEEILKTVVFRDADQQKPARHVGHDLLAAIVARFGPRTLFTTNWDLLLEEALGESGITITESNLRGIDRVYDDGNTAVIHLHGTFADNPLIREEDLMDPDRPLFQLFTSELMTKAFVFVGYSLNDFNIRALYSKARNILARRSQKLKKKTYIVSPPRDDIDRRVSSEIWAHRDAEYLPIGAEEFFQLLYSEAATNYLDDMKQQLKERLNIRLEDLQVKIDEIVRVFPDFQNPEQVVRYLDAITKGRRQ